MSRDVDNDCNYTDIHHSGNDCQLVLKPCKSVDCAGESGVYHHVQYKAADNGWQPVEAADELSICSFAWHCAAEMMNISEVTNKVSINKVNTNFINSLSQGGCKSSKYVRVICQS